MFLIVLLKNFHTYRCHLSCSVFLLEIFSSSGHCTCVRFVRTSYSLNLYCSLACRVCLWTEYCDVPRCCHECTWGHVSCTAIAPALRFPRFLGVQITADNSAKPWCYLCRRRDENTPCSPALEIPLSDLVTRSSFPHTSSQFCSLLCFRESLTTNTIDFSCWKLSHSKFLTWSILFTHKLWLALFLRPQSMPSPFDSLLLSTLHLFIYAARFPGHSSPYTKRSGLHLSRAGGLQSQKRFLWIEFSPYVFADLFPCQKLTPLRHSWLGPARSHLHQTLASLPEPLPLGGSVIPGSPSSLHRQAGRSRRGPRCGAMPAATRVPARLCPPCGEVTRATPGTYNFELTCFWVTLYETVQ